MTDKDTRPTKKFVMLDERIDALTMRVEQLEKIAKRMIDPKIIYPGKDRDFVFPEEF